MPAHFNEEPAEVVGQVDVDEKGNSDKSSDPEETRHATGADLKELGTNDKYEITEEDCYNELGFKYPTWKKWYILTIIFWIQVSMNFNTSLYSVRQRF